MWLAGCFLITAAISDVALGAGSRPKQNLQVEPASVGLVNASAESHLAAHTSSCADEDAFESTLDKLAFDLFIEPPAHESPDVTYVRHLLNGLSFGAQDASAHEKATAPVKAAATRLRGWWNAVARVQHNTSLVAHDNTSTKHDGDKATVLPTACAASLPANDPYWSQKDSYWVCDDNGACDPYNECKYSDGCKREFTNGERVSSLRRTLQATHYFLNAQGATHMLFGGTVIGAYRCQDVLPWDLDTDVVVLNDDFPKLLMFLDGAPSGTGYKNKGRSMDMATIGVPGFTMMEKYPGCHPLVIVDQSTGFFTDIFPMTARHGLMYSPWWNGKVLCDAASLFNGCHNERCDTWSPVNTLPTSACTMHTAQHNCAANLQGFLYEYYGTSVNTADRPVRALRGNLGIKPDESK